MFICFFKIFGILKQPNFSPVQFAEEDNERAAGK